MFSIHTRKSLLFFFLLLLIQSLNALPSVEVILNHPDTISRPLSVSDGLKWRMIGPHRGGRTVGAVGVPQQPNVFYIGVNNGGV